MQGCYVTRVALFGKTQQSEFGFGRLLVQPKGLRLQNHVDAGRTVFALVDEELLGFGHCAVVGEVVGHAEIHQFAGRWTYRKLGAILCA